MQIDDASPIPKQPTFLQTLLTNKYLSPTLSNQQSSINTADLSDEIIPNNIDEDTFIPITSNDKSRLYEPWKYSVIIKIFGRKIVHHILRNKLLALWKPTEDLPIFDLGLIFSLSNIKKKKI